jgi:AraC-like DNA-binding protein
MIYKYHLRNMFSKSSIQLLDMVFSVDEEIEIVKIQLGEVHLKLKNAIDSDKRVRSILEKFGFEIIENSEDLLVEKIKLAAIELIIFSYNSNSLIRNSEYISMKLQLPYDKISKLFKKVTGSTLEKYIILLKIEKSKEMLLSNDFSVSEISFMLGYSSVHYLSNQFKKITGQTISEFKEKDKNTRIPIENLI